MRLFIAFNFDREAKDALTALQDRLRNLAAGGNFSRQENLHLTLAFLGETPESQVPLIREIIQGLEIPAAGEGRPGLNLCRTGCFRHSGKELWWAGPDRDDPGLPLLLDLRRRLAAGLERRGIDYDRRAFNVHITLGREIRGIPAGPADLVPEGGIPLPLRRLSLMQSGRAGGLLKYTELYGRDLAAS
jgi:2'-5' RNA ligase